jgi:uncharacterized phage protein (TIGR02218 family)
MKTLSTSLLAVLGQSTPTLAEAWKVERTDGQTYGWTAHDRTVSIAGVSYRASEGLQVTAAHTTDDLRVDSIDVTAFLDVTTEEELLAGIWDDALVTNFWYNWNNPPAALDTNVLVVRYGNVGQIARTEGAFTAQVRGLAQRLNVRIGRQYTPGCPWRHALWNGSTYVSSVECGLTLTTYIHTGTVTSLASPPTREFLASGDAHTNGYYNDGLITMTSGDNAGLTREVRVWNAFQFSLKRPFPYAVAVSDTFSAVKGDDKSWASCLAYSNQENFGGFPHIPGFNKVYSNVVDL